MPPKRPKDAYGYVSPFRDRIEQEALRNASLLFNYAVVNPDMIPEMSQSQYDKIPAVRQRSNDLYNADLVRDALERRIVNLGMTNGTPARDAMGYVSPNRLKAQQTVRRGQRAPNYKDAKALIDALLARKP